MTFKQTQQNQTALKFSKIENNQINLDAVKRKILSKLENKLLIYNDGVFQVTLNLIKNKVTLETLYSNLNIDSNFLEKANELFKLVESLETK